MKAVFKLAWRNLVAYKKLYIRLAVAFVALIFLITLISCFTLAVRQQQEDLITSRMSKNYTYDDRKVDGNAISQQFQTITVERYKLNEYVSELTGKETALTSDFVDVSFEGKNYYYHGIFKLFTVYTADEWNIITPNDYIEMRSDEPLMIGRYPEAADEIVVSEQYLKGCGLSRDVLGKSVSFSIFTGWDEEGGTRNVIPVTTELTVCGIITNDYYVKLGGHYAQEHFSPTVLLHKSNTILTVDTQTMYICSFDGWISRETEKYLKSEGFNYCGESFSGSIRLTENLQMVVNQLTLYFVSALVFGIVITAFLLIERLCASSIKNSGIMQMAGMTGKQTFAVWLVQILFVGVMSLIIAAPLTYGAMSLINAIIDRTFWVSFKVSAGLYFAVVGIGLAIVIALSVAALCYVVVKRKGKRTRDLLDT